MKCHFLAVIVGSWMFCSLACSAQAAVLFSENFNGVAGQNQNNTQYLTGLKVAFGGDLTNWTESGAGTTHLVDRTGADDWAAMFYNGTGGGSANQIDSIAIAGGNTLGQMYQIAFEVAPGSYNAESQASTATDGVVIQVLDSLNAVVAQQTYIPGEFSLSATPGNLAFASAVLDYIGTGSGDGSISIRVLTNWPSGSNKFGGSIDNLTLSSVPEPATIALLPFAGLAIWQCTRWRNRRQTA